LCLDGVRAFRKAKTIKVRGYPYCLVMNEMNFEEDEALDPNSPYLISPNDEDIPLTSLSIRGATADPLRDYLRQISTLPEIQPGQDLELASQVEAGVLAKAELMSDRANIDDEYRRDLSQIVKLGQQARTRLIEGNMGLVVKTAKRNAGQGLPILDLIQEGTIGLVHAIEKFDYRQGSSFAGFAWYSIQQSMVRAVMDQAHAIRIPVHMGESIKKMQRLRLEMLMELEREPSEKELAARMGLSVMKVREMKSYMLDPIPLDTPLDEDGTALGEVLADSDDDLILGLVISKGMREAIERALWGLTDREAAVIKKRFGLGGEPPKTLEEIGEMFGLTRERIRQIEAKAMSKLQEPELAIQVRIFLDSD
jgi:RNA polymerase primary sigma factor